MLPEDKLRLDKYIEGLSKLGLFSVQVVNEGQEWAFNYGNQMNIATITYNQHLPFNDRFKLQINKVIEVSIMDSIDEQ